MRNVNKANWMKISQLEFEFEVFKKFVADFAGPNYNQQADKSHCKL